MSLLRRIVTAIRGPFSRKPKRNPHAVPFSRKHRRAIMFARTEEKQMRALRTAIRWAKRHRNRKPSDNGAKYRRAYESGFQKGGIVALEALRERAKANRQWVKPAKLAA